MTQESESDDIDRTDAPPRGPHVTPYGRYLVVRSRLWWRADALPKGESRPSPPVSPRIETRSIQHRSLWTGLTA